MKLSKLLVGVVEVEQDVEVGGLTSDSRKVEPGFVFVAYRGIDVDGHDFVNQAIEKGAVVVVGEENLNLSVPYFKVDDGRKAWARMEAAWRDNPQKKLKFIGVTGTDGKTTTANLIYEILKVAGKKVGMVSTISAKIGDEELDTGLHTSSPAPDVLFEILAKMRDGGVEYVILETTSHGLAQDRLEGIDFEIGVLTNFAHDHLEFHKTAKNYKQAKGMLFEKSEVSVLNKNCKEVGYFVGRTKGKIVYYDVSKEIRRVKYKKRGEVQQEFELKFGESWLKIESYLLGRYNLENILAASKVAEFLGLQGASPDAATGTVGLKVGVESLQRLAGRFEVIENKKGLNVVVDFAHTQQGVRAVLGMVRDNLMEKNGRLITVFGCNGERDRSKRAPMGETACKLSDLVMVTTEDPRNENLDQIFADIEKGCKKTGGKLGKNYFREDDRYKAIEMAVKMACKGDWVMVLGKGHEKSMNIMGVEYDWDDVVVTKSILEER